MLQASNPASATLVWRTRDSARHLLQASIASLALCLASGLVLWLSPPHDHLILVALCTHLSAGVLAGIFFLPFVVIHLQDGREPLGLLLQPWRLLPAALQEPVARHRLMGHGLLWSLLLALGSGLVIALPAVAYLAGRPVTLPYGSQYLLLDLHQGATLACLGLLLLHFPWKERT